MSRGFKDVRSFDKGSAARRRCERLPNPTQIFEISSKPLGEEKTLYCNDISQRIEGYIIKIRSLANNWNAHIPKRKHVMKINGIGDSIDENATTLFSYSYYLNDVL